MATAVISGSTTTRAKEGIVLDGTGSSYTGTSPFTNGTHAYNWSSSDMPVVVVTHIPYFPHVFTVPGTYTVTLTVKDADGSSDTVTHNVTVSAISEAGSVTTLTDTGDPDTNTTNLENAAAAANYGDIIEMPPSWVGLGPVVFPNRGAGTNYIIIRTTAYTALPQTDVRVTEADLPNMPTIQYPSNDGWGTFPPGAIQFAQGAHNYWFQGIAFTQQDTTTTQGTGLIELGDADSAQNTLAKMPYDLILDHCVLYDQSPTMTGPKRAISLQSGRCTIIDCHIAGGLEPNSTGQDGQGIAGWNGAGPWFVVNNLIQGVSECFAIGGATPPITGLVAQFIEVRRNYLHKLTSWHDTSPDWDGVQWSVKNYFELKSAMYVTFTENYCDNLYLDHQSGYACLNLTVRGDSGGQATIQFADFEWNRFFHGPEAVRLLLKDTSAASTQGFDVYIENNLFDAIDPGVNGTGYFMGLSYGGPRVSMNHNTSLNTSSIAFIPSAKGSNPFLPDENAYAYIILNMAFHGNLVGAPAQGTTLQTFNYYMPGSTFSRNMVQGGSAGDWPAGTDYFPASWATQFVDYNGGVGGDYTLADGSLGQNNATDGSDVGVPFVTLEVVTLHSIDGEWAEPLVSVAVVLSGGVTLSGGVIIG